MRVLGFRSSGSFGFAAPPNHFSFCTHRGIFQPGNVVCIFSPRIQEAEEGEPQVQGQPGLYNDVLSQNKTYPKNLDWNRVQSLKCLTYKRKDLSLMSRSQGIQAWWCALVVPVMDGQRQKDTWTFWSCKLASLVSSRACYHVLDFMWVLGTKLRYSACAGKTLPNGNLFRARG